MADPCASLVEQRRALDSGASSRDLVAAALARADALEPRLRSLVDARREAALVEADASDERRRRGESLSPLDGLPLALKDNLVARGEPTTCCSKILSGFVSPYDSTVVSRLRSAGAVIVARTNMDEFAMGSSTENSVQGPTRNPWDLERVAGGSSGGSAAAVSAGIVPGALGSDTGGSIRQPSALCGVVGLKPTYGRVSRFGLVAFASSLDQIGPLTRTAEDAAVLLQAIAGHDPADSTSIAAPVPDYRDALTGDVSGLTLGLPAEYMDAEGADPQVLERVESAVREFESAGAKVRPVSLPHMRYGVAAYYLICTAEASSNLARYDGARYGFRAEGATGLGEMYRRTRSEGFGDEVKRRILLGTYVLSSGYYEAWYARALRVRGRIARELAAAFGRVDLLLSPTAPTPAFGLGELASDPLSMYLADVLTVPASLAGLPAVSVPCGTAQPPGASGGPELPVGLQIAGP
ncbi:MAG: Asp-tRNA(Asn)/Glu-tRNA(Gln) amidotransferase subunit GatA, partial [Proteobacteria bacterium]|nr:Asp-tRNA(Asn)/Glu-tRNA(Gln) amidotransferase subunit GatA [Pseudomonadota bacterium]